MNSNQAGSWARPGYLRNQQELQKWAALAGGSALAVLGVTRRSPAGWMLAAAGGALAYSGLRATPNGSPRRQSRPDLGSNILVNASPQEAYRLWRDLEHATRYMTHIELVSPVGDRRYEWIARGPMGLKVQWTAEITDEREGEYIVWRSLPGSDLNVSGRVQFTAAPANRGTIISAQIHYTLANRSLARAANAFVGRQAKFFVRQDMRRFKALLETGEVPTIEGQTHGLRSAVAAVARTVNPDRPLRGNWRAREVYDSMRRVS